MNVFEAFEEILCNVVLEAKTPREREIAQATRDVYQVAMKYINDPTLVTMDGKLETRVHALTKAAALLMGFVATLSVPRNEPEGLDKFFEFLNVEAREIQILIAKGIRNGLQRASDGGAFESLKAMIAKLRREGKLQ